jgi:hypothetical protein
MHNTVQCVKQVGAIDSLSWHQHLMNPEALSTLFDSMEGLDWLDVIEVGLKRDGRVVVLRADLARYPERPSRRWTAQANRVQVELQLIGVEELRIAGLGATNQGTLEVAPLRGSYSFLFDAPGLLLSGQCDALRIAGVSAYCDDGITGPGMDQGR